MPDVVQRFKGLAGEPGNMTTAQLAAAEPAPTTSGSASWSATRRSRSSNEAEGNDMSYLHPTAASRSSHWRSAIPQASGRSWRPRRWRTPRSAPPPTSSWSATAACWRAVRRSPVSSWTSRRCGSVEELGGHPGTVLVDLGHLDPELDRGRRRVAGRGRVRAAELPHLHRACRRRAGRGGLLHALQQGGDADGAPILRRRDRLWAGGARRRAGRPASSTSWRACGTPGSPRTCRCRRSPG